MNNEQAVAQELHNFLTTPIEVPTIQKWKVTITRNGFTATLAAQTPWNKKHSVMLDQVKAIIAEQIQVSTTDLAAHRNGITATAFKKDGVIY